MSHPRSAIWPALAAAALFGASTPLVKLLVGEPTPAPFWLAAGLMGAGVWLHLTERHAHAHTHELLEHTHPHVHGAHHPSEHDFDWLVRSRARTSPG